MGKTRSQKMVAKGNGRGRVIKVGGLNKMCVFSAVIKPASGNITRKGGVMNKDIEILRELKKEFLQSIELLKLLEEETDETE